MPLDLSLNIGGDQLIQRRLLGIADRALDWRPAWQMIGDEIMAMEARQFASEGAFGSGGWPALADSTKAQRVAQGYGPGPILDRTGAMKRSLSVKGAANQVMVMTPDRFAFGSTDEKLRFHQQGTSRMPARKQEFPASGTTKLVKIAHRHWIEGTR